MSWWLFGERPNLSILISLPIVMIGLVLISGILMIIHTVSIQFVEYCRRFYSYFLFSFFNYLQICKQRVGSAVNLQFDSTAGCAIGLLILSFLPLQSIHVEPINFELVMPMHGWLLSLAILSQVVGWLAIAILFLDFLQPILHLLFCSSQL